MKFQLRLCTTGVVETDDDGIGPRSSGTSIARPVIEAATMDVVKGTPSVLAQTAGEPGGQGASASVPATKGHRPWKTHRQVPYVCTPLPNLLRVYVMPVLTSCIYGISLCGFEGPLS